MSLLSWERGLKYSLCRTWKNSTASLLSWERGLKYLKGKSGIKRMLVAPLVGAWIEIEEKMPELQNVLVAPLVGAWIEIMFLIT